MSESTKRKAKGCKRCCRKNVTIVNNEIDYDKLAEAIVRANTLNTIEVESPEESETGVFSFIWSIIRNKRKTNGKITSVMFGMVLSIVFNILAVIITVIALCMLLVSVYEMTTWSWNGVAIVISNIVVLIYMFIIIVLFLLFALVARGVANECGEEQDKNYLVSFFSAIVSLVALIVAMITFLKGVT